MIVGGNFTFDPNFNVNQIDSSKTSGFFDMSEASEASAEDAFIHSPTRSIYELSKGWGLTSEPEGKHLSPVDIGIKKNTEFYAQYMNVPKEGMTEREYNTKYEAIRAEKLRENALMRAPDTVGQFLKTMGVSLGVSMLDPTSIALGYMPAALARGGYLGAKAASTAKKFDDNMLAAEAGGRAALRAEAGAVGGTFEGVVAEAPVYFAANERGEKYGASEVFTSIATGVVVGSAIQVSAGALFDVATIKERRFDREKLRIDKEAEANKEADAQDLLTRSFIREGSISPIQSNLANYTQQERAAFMQAGLSQFSQGNRVLGHEYAQAFEARSLGERYKPGDTAKVRDDVIAEHLQSELELKSTARVDPQTREAFVANTKALRSEIDNIKSQIESLEKRGTSNASREKAQAEITKRMAELEAINEGVEIGLKKGASKSKRAEYQRTIDLQKTKTGELNDLKDNFETTLKNEKNLDLELARSELEITKRLLDDHRQGFKLRENYAKRIRERAKSLLNVEDIPMSDRMKINEEIARRMRVINEIHPVDSAKAGNAKPEQLWLKNIFTDMNEKLNSPEASRTHRPDAERQFSESGRRTNATEDSAKLEQEKTDAIQNAQKLAEDNDAKYELTKQEAELVSEIENMKKAADKLAVCMGRAA